MTIKEIKELTNKSYKTICNWCGSVNNSDISEKITQAKEKSKPADFTLDETIVILRAGKISESLISLLTENAKIKQSNNLTIEAHKNLELNRIERLESLVEKLIEIMPKMINNNVKQMEIKQDYYSILGYCRMKNIEVSFSEAIHYGKEATRLSKENYVEMRKIPDERFGFVNSYEIWILDKVFAI